MAMKAIYHLLLFQQWVGGLDEYGAISGQATELEDSFVRKLKFQNPSFINGSSQILTKVYLKEVARRNAWSDMMSCMLVLPIKSIILLVQAILDFCSQSNEVEDSMSCCLRSKVVSVLIHGFVRPKTDVAVLSVFLDFFNKIQNTISLAELSDLYVEAASSICDSLTECSVQLLHLSVAKIGTEFKVLVETVLSSFIQSTSCGSSSKPLVSKLRLTKAMYSELLKNIEFPEDQEFNETVQKVTKLDNRPENTSPTILDARKNCVNVRHFKTKMSQGTETDVNDIIEDLGILKQAPDSHYFEHWIKSKNDNYLKCFIEHLYFNEEYELIFNRFLTYVTKHEDDGTGSLRITRILNRISSNNNNVDQNQNLDIPASHLEELKYLTVICPITLMDTMLGYAKDRIGSANFLCSVLGEINGFAQLPYEQDISLLVSRLAKIFIADRSTRDLQKLKNISDFVHCLMRYSSDSTFPIIPPISRTELCYHCVLSVLRDQRQLGYEQSIGHMFALQTLKVITTSQSGAISCQSWLLLVPLLEILELLTELACILDDIFTSSQFQNRLMEYGLVWNCVENILLTISSSSSFNKSQKQMKEFASNAQHSNQWCWKTVLIFSSWISEAKLVQSSDEDLVSCFWLDSPSSLNGFHVLDRLLTTSCFSDSLQRLAVRQIWRLHPLQADELRVELIRLIIIIFLSYSPEETTRACKIFVPCLVERGFVNLSFDSEFLNCFDFKEHDIVKIKAIHLVARALVYCHEFQEILISEQNQRPEKLRMASKSFASIILTYSQEECSEDINLIDKAWVLAEYIRINLNLLWIPELEPSAKTLLISCLELVSTLSQTLKDIPESRWKPIKLKLSQILIQYADHVSMSSGRKLLRERIVALKTKN